MGVYNPQDYAQWLGVASSIKHAVLTKGGEMILLSPEEIKEVYHSCSVGGFIRSEVEKAIARAQLKKVVEWGNEDCTEHGFIITEEVLKYPPRHQCPKCWQVLRKEVNDERQETSRRPQEA